MNMEWAKDVQIQPEKELAVSREKPVKMKLINNSNRHLAFKLRTTRIEDVTPNVGMGILQPNGQTDFDVNFKSITNARQFSGHDLITILMHELPPQFMTAQSYWHSKDQSQPERFVIALKPPPPWEKSTTSSNVSTAATSSTQATKRRKAKKVNQRKRNPNPNEEIDQWNQMIRNDDDR